MPEIKPLSLPYRFSPPVLRCLFIVVTCLVLQGCLLDFFFAPKIAPEDLPGSVELRELKSAYATHCGRCHVLVAPRFFDALHPIELYTRRYQLANVISESEQAEVEAYLRALIAETGRR